MADPLETARKRLRNAFAAFEDRPVPQARASLERAMTAWQTALVERGAKALEEERDGSQD